MSSQVPSGLDSDPTAYLSLPRLNKTLDFPVDSELACGGDTATVTYALTDAPSDGSWPLLVFFNGLGGHRLIASLIEGIAREHHVQILAIDKPNGGGSAQGVSLPLHLRTRWMHTALLAVLASEHRTRFAVFSHSNGVFYSLYTLLHLPPTLTVTSWTLSAPFVPHKISGNIGLGIAAALPTALPNAFGSLLQIVPPVARAANWSSGLLSAPSSSTQAESIAALEARKSPHEREYMHRSVGSACRVEVMRRSLAESRVAIGQETLFCLHGSSSTGGETVWGLGAGASDAEVLRGAFSRLVERYPGDALSMRVVYGAADGLVPTKGRVWLKATLEELELLRDEQACTEVSGAGHDDVLFREEVMSGMLKRVVR